MDRDITARLDPDETALAWLTRMRGTPTAADRTAFEQWLAASPSHRAAWRRAESLWSATGDAGFRVAGEEDAQLSAYLKAMDRSKRRKSVRRGGTALGVLLALFCGAVWLEKPNLLQDVFADHVTARGERRLVMLPDSSTVLMNADTAVDVDFSSGHRMVKLLRGTAYFAVRKTGVPFTVTAGEGQVHVLGTEFEVSRAASQAVVTLAEGRVEVGAGEQTAALAPGQQVHFAANRIGAVSNVDIDEALAWREGRIVFYDAKLSDVVAEIARYRPGRIVIASDALANRVISGSLPLDNPDAALQSLQSSVGFSMHSVAGRLVILN